ncbi:MAG: LPXTG cell wall anchor domain-containing protein [Clostridia bacterium]|nr:LPXTG cell wall anchor domain-containing protein [Clostridia bacterium]
MKNNKLFTIIISALMIFVCSATAFAEDIMIPETEPSTITEVTDVSDTDNTTRTDAEEVSTESDAESTADEDNEGVTVIREEVTLETTEPAETEIIIDTSDVSITKGEPENEIVFDYADATTGIPNTGSSKVVAVGALAAVCSAIAGLIITKKKKA